jgi:regulator of cell morphogenesis and NO signaling
VTTPPTILPSDTLGALAIRSPHLVPVLDELGLDYCCSGHRTLAEACTEAGVDVGQALAALRAHASEPTVDTSLQSLTELRTSVVVDHIEVTHHAFLRLELPRLGALLDRVHAAHVEEHPELTDVRDAYVALRDELDAHLAREQLIVFPLIREIDAADRSGHEVNGELRNPVTVVHDDHEHVKVLLAQIRELIDAHPVPDDACASYSALFDGLVALADEIHLDLHKENNILLPAALELERHLHERTDPGASPDR